METNEFHTSILQQLSDIKSSLAVNTTETTNIKVRLTEMQKDIKDTANAVQFQNGRVSKLENWSIESQKIIESTSKLASDTAKSYDKDRNKMIAGFLVLMFLGGTIITLAIMAIDSKIKDGIQQAIADSGVEEDKLKDLIK